jgi:hypothetical protein
MFNILGQIIGLAYIGALDSRALDTVCAVQKGCDPVLLATMRAAHAATEAALAVALAPFGVTPRDRVPGAESSFVGSDGRTIDTSMDYATGARVFGARLVEGR